MNEACAYAPKATGFFFSFPFLSLHSLFFYCLCFVVFLVLSEVLILTGKHGVYSASGFDSFLRGAGSVL